ncbi:MAG TPA: carboxypeptidase-like regulatory domain-containing protein [Chthonomonadaceae bacterium]|nr:carboxypeptidase-like regulatory domain-containing protein [Chthonomonadaceae bacterium]
MSGAREDRASRRATLKPGSTWALVLLLALLAIGGQGPARAEDLVWVTGHVVGADNRPLAGALVAVYDDSNKVVDYARTDKNGDYALAVPRRVLHLEKRGKGFFTEVFGGITRFVGGAVGFVANPLRAGVHAITSSQASNFADPLTKGEIMAGGAVADQLLFAVSPREKKPTPQEERKQPGALLMKVVTRGSNDMVGVARVYWVQQEVFKAGGKQQRTLAAWLDPVCLSSVDSEKPSAVEARYMRFTAARLEPSLAEPGQRVRIVAKFPLPPDPPVYVVVVARNNRTGQTWQLMPIGDGLFEAEFEVDKRFPRDDQVISILAYAAQSTAPGRRPDTERAIEGAGLWDLKKPYLYNPLLVVSRNRADLTLTVVVPDKHRR